MDKPIIQPWRPDPNPFRQPEPPLVPMEFLSRSWSASAVEVSRALAPSQPPLMPQKGSSSSSSSGGHISEGINAKLEETPIISGIIPFSFASSETSQMVLERIMSQSQDLSPRTSGRISNSSDHLNRSHSGSSGSPPISPSDVDVKQSCHLNNGQFLAAAAQTAMAPPAVATGSKTVGRWLKDKKQKKKEEVRAHNAQLHAAISVAGVAAAVAGMTTARAASSTTGKDEQMAKNDMAVSSAATLVFAQCVEGAEAFGADRDHLTSVVSSALNVRSSGDIVTLTAAAATALRGAATLKARMLKEVWNVATAVPSEKEKGGGRPNGNQDGELEAEENLLGVNNAIELLARGSQLLKRTRKGELHWKMVYVYINRMNQVMLKMKSKHVAGTMTKKKKNVVVEVVKEMPAWPGRHLLEGGADRRYFGLRTLLRGVVEFECRNQREYEVWTQGVSRLLSISAQRNTRYRI